jgi:hypothetical protein
MSKTDVAMTAKSLPNWSRDFSRKWVVPALL